jgi:hypothetical protein
LKNELGLLGELVDDNAGVVAVQPGDVQALLTFFQLIFQPEKQKQQSESRRPVPQ